jgi:hypothetical protein
MIQEAKEGYETTDPTLHIDAKNKDSLDKHAWTAR